MNGWKRIGIILSVLWITGGGIWTRGVVMREMGSSAKAQLHTCTTLHPNDTDPCFAKFDADWGRDVTDAGDQDLQRDLHLRPADSSVGAFLHHCRAHPLGGCRVQAGLMSDSNLQR